MTYTLLAFLVMGEKFYVREENKFTLNIVHQTLLLKTRKKRKEENSPSRIVCLQEGHKEQPQILLNP